MIDIYKIDLALFFHVARDTEIEQVIQHGYMATLYIGVISINNILKQKSDL